MRSLLLIQLALIATLSVGVSGCLSSGGGTEVPSVQVPPDFEVEEPNNGSSSGGNNNGGQPTGPDGETEVPEQPPVVVNPNADFLINDGKSATRDLNLDLTMYASSTVFAMKVGYTADCSDGEWIGYSQSHQMAVTQMNAAVTISAMYRDDENMFSRCIVRSIRHDSKGPEIVINRSPLSNIEEGSAPELEYTVVDASGLGPVTCSLNGVSKSCAGGNQVIKMTPLAPGAYTFVVAAEDKLGNASSVQVTWNVVSTTRLMNQLITVNNYNKVDILLNIDNSGSMAYEQKSMAQRMSKFLSILRGLDYQIAVTTTDERNVALGDGQLIPIHGSGGEFILDTSTPEDIAQARLGMTLQRPETGSGAEQGIFTSRRVIERSLAGTSTAHTRFIRDGAQLAVVVISDEDESATGTKNNPENLAKLIHDSYGGQKTFTWHSIITKPGDTNCKSTYGATYGARYAQFSTLTGGIIGSVCESDYAAQVSGIATGIRNMLKTLTLECQAMSQHPITVTKDGQAFNGTFVVEGINLKFATELAPGNYSVSYRCLR